MAKQKKKKTERSKELEALREELKKEYGEGVVKRYTKGVSIPSISTGVIALDDVLGGGMPEGRMLELVGENSSGKTTLALSIGAAYQKKHPDRLLIYVDVEHALDTLWAEKLGVAWETFEHCEPAFGEDAFTIVEAYLNTGKAGVIIIDSVAALLPKGEMEGDYGEVNIGMQARLVSSAMKRINYLLNNNPKTIVIFINQKRASINSGGGSFNYEPTKATGGKALPFYMTTRINMFPFSKIRNSKEEVIGQEVKVDVIKNKINNGPGGRVIFRILGAVGLDIAHEILIKAKDAGLIDQGGAWYTIVETGEKVQGSSRVKEIIRNNLKEWFEKLNLDF